MTSATVLYVLTRLTLSLTTGQIVASSTIQSYHFTEAGLHACVGDQLKQVVTSSPPPGLTYVFYCERTEP